MVRPIFRVLMRSGAENQSGVGNNHSAPDFALNAVKLPHKNVAMSDVKDAYKKASEKSVSRLFALALLSSVTSIVVGGSFAIPTQALAQISGAELFGEVETTNDEQLLLESDELVYDDANQNVSAVGNVQIAYGNYTLIADRVTYSRSTGRVIATGNVEIVEPDGNKLFADEIDITDDFQDGFVKALRIETADNTRFTAESAERRDGEIAILHNGVYTACEACKDHPEKPPFWQIRAKRVIVNTKTRRVEYEGASFELFGKPIIYLNKFSHGDPSIKRSSGFLFPEYGSDDKLGYHLKQSYFLAMAPNYDATVSGTYYSNQGFLGQAEWRHRTQLGQYKLSFAGIDQQGLNEFDVGTIDGANSGRHAIMSSGKFDLNRRWKFGWNALHQSDENFARTYSLEGFSSREVTNEVYLTGLNGKNHFDLRAQQFLIQDEKLNQISDTYSPGNDKLQDQQAKVLPSFDYNLVTDTPIAGGQVSLDVNVVSLKRGKADIANFTGTTDKRYHGVAGKYTRASAEIDWKASKILQGGALVTASLSARSDAMLLDTDTQIPANNPLTSNKSIYRTMPAAMLEIRYPMIATNGTASHIFEPIAQLIVRPDESKIGKMPNEDAQSFVFDTTNLFERDKYSGFDRVEGGTRANIGFQYSANFADGASVNVVAGQSIHIDGKNSFAERDLVNAGLESGLETKKSDYVASVDLNSKTGFSLGASGRFDEKNTNLRRGELTARYVDPKIALSGSYVFIDAQPKYGFANDRHEARGSASVKLNDQWRAFGAGTFDLENSEMISQSVGISYDDSCVSFSVAYSENNNRYDGSANDRSINFSLGLRTIGSVQHKRSLLN
ncbi:MAG: LPS-assembly protein LptD [Rhizobiales bacterium]|nr:LPS-assembly protein LptD [Hyphomicrobiales bacterium]